MSIDKEIKDELRELVKLVRMDEKYTALVSDGFLPLDKQSYEYNHERKTRIDELSRKYGIA